MSGNGNGTSNGEVVLVNAGSGIAVIGTSTQLKGLNYFDGKFLRAEDLQTEQSFLRHLVYLSSQGGGAGVVYGYDVTSADGASVTVKQGLAFDALGRPLLLTVDKTLDLGALVAATQKQDPAATGSPAGSSEFADCTVALAAGTVPTTPGSDLYLLTVAFVEALCGEEDVFGRLCEEACVDAKNRRFILDGVVFRALPLVGLGPLPGTVSGVPMEPKHYRSRVASAFFQAERQAVPSQVSGAGIQGGVFCLGARQLAGEDVPIAVFSRSGATTNFIDAWIGRRERIEPPNRRYWAWRMSMRPWDVFLAQVFQFQCQLADVLGGALTGGPGGDPCAPKTAALGRAQEVLARLEQWHAKTAAALSGARALSRDIQPFALSEITSLRKDLSSVLLATPLTGTRILLGGGIVELPPAGYLPVTVGSIPTVNEQVRNLMGPGVDLRFCVCRPDYIPHVLEEAQHMERISLLDGIDDPAHLPHVDVFVPDGTIVDHAAADDSRYFDGTVVVGVSNAKMKATAGRLAADRLVRGAARWQPLDGGGMEFYLGGIDVSAVFEAVGGLGREVVAGIRDRVRAMRVPAAAPAEGTAGTSGTAAIADWIDATVDRDPFQIGPSESALFHVRTISFERGGNSDGSDHCQVTRIWPGLFTPTAAPQVVNGESVAVGMFQAFQTDQEKAPGASGQPVPDTSSTPVTLRRKRGTPSYVQAEATLVPGRPPLVVRWEWTGDGGDRSQLVNGSLKLVFEAGQRTVLVLAEDPDARNPANLFHGYSETGIATLQRALAAPPFDDTTFAAGAESALFPQAVAKDPFDVLATRDWVVFARRRECTCQGEAFTPPPPPARFQVYWVDGDKFDQGEGDAFLQRLMDPAQTQYVKDLRSRGVLNALDVVAFAAGAATLDGPASTAALSDLRTAVAGKTTLFGVVIGEGRSDPLEGARMLTYQALAGGFLAPPAPPDAMLTQVLSGIPPALADPTVDGVILVGVGTQAQATELVFRVQPAYLGSSVGVSGDRFAASNLGAILKYSTRLGPLSFTGGGSTPDASGAAAVKAAWRAQADDFVWQVFTYYKDAQSAGLPLGDRAVAVEKMLGGDGTHALPPQQAPAGLASAFAESNVLVCLVPALKTAIWALDPTNDRNDANLANGAVDALASGNEPLGVWVTDYGTGELRTHGAQSLQDAVNGLQLGVPTTLAAFWGNDRDAGAGAPPGDGWVGVRVTSISQPLAVTSPSPPRRQPGTAAYQDAPVAAFVTLRPAVNLERGVRIRVMRLPIQGDAQLKAFEAMKPAGFWRALSRLGAVDLGPFSVPEAPGASGSAAGPVAEVVRKRWGDHRPLRFRAFLRSSALQPARAEKLAQGIASALAPGAGPVQGDAVAAPGIADQPAFAVAGERVDVVVVVASSE